MIMRKICAAATAAAISFLLVLVLGTSAEAQTICRTQVQCKIDNCTGFYGDACVNSGGAQTLGCGKGWYEPEAGYGECGAFLIWWNLYWDCVFPAGTCGGTRATLNNSCV